MRVLVCGSRDYVDQDLLWEVLDDFLRGEPKMELIEGGARGADSLAHKWASRNKVPTHTFRANWEEYGKRAGFIRNQQMLDEGKPNVVLAFFTDIHNKSKGTLGMIKIAQKAGVEVFVFPEISGGNTPEEQSSF